MMLATCPNCTHKFSLNGKFTPKSPPKNNGTGKTTGKTTEKYTEQKIPFDYFPPEPSKPYINFPLTEEERVRCILSGGKLIQNSSGSSVDEPENTKEPIDKIKAESVSKNTTGNIPEDRSNSATSSKKNDDILSLFDCKIAEPTSSLRDKIMSKASPLSDVIKTKNDERKLLETLTYLERSGWYHKSLSWRESINLLMASTVGTFLIRDSSDPKYLFSLTVQSKCGPTSIRMKYVNGSFQLDADPHISVYMPRFTDIFDLIDYYVIATKQQLLLCTKDVTRNQVWVDSIGNIFSQIEITKPFYVKVPSLKHLSRIEVNKCRANANQPLPGWPPVKPEIEKYLREYPYTR